MALCLITRVGWLFAAIPGLGSWLVAADVVVTQSLIGAGLPTKRVLARGEPPPKAELARVLAAVVPQVHHAETGRNLDNML